MTAQEQMVPEGATVYDLSADLVTLLAQPEMQELRKLLSAQGAKLLLAQLGSMTPEQLLALRAKVAPGITRGPVG